MGPLLIGILLLTLMIWHVTWVARRLLPPTHTRPPAPRRPAIPASQAPVATDALEEDERALTRQLLDGTLDPHTYQDRMQALAHHHRQPAPP